MHFRLWLQTFGLYTIWIQLLYIAMLALFYEMVFVLYLRFSPPSAHSRLSLAAWLLTNFFKWDSSRAFHTSSSLYFSKGSRFIRRVPEKRTGSYKCISITANSSVCFKQHYTLCMFVKCAWRKLSIFIETICSVERTVYLGWPEVEKTNSKFLFFILESLMSL